MNTTLARLGCALIFAISAGNAFGDEVHTRDVGEGAFVNSDCSWPLVVRFQRCHVECVENRDCAGGWVCTQQSMSGTSSTAGVCKPPPPPPPAPGGFTGRVEGAPGEGTACSIEVWRGSSMAMTVGCNAVSGGFAAENLPGGLYLLRVTAGPYGGKRDFLAPVNPGEITYLGALVVMNPMVVNPARPALPGSDSLLRIAPNAGERLPPQTGRPPPVR